jgi:hypothetical protein
LSLRTRRLLAAIVTASLLPVVALPATALGASGDLWALNLLDPVGFHPRLALAPDGSHRAAVNNEHDNGTIYTTDESGDWKTTNLNGGLADVAVGADGKAYVLTQPDHDPQQEAWLTIDTGGTLTTEEVPDSQGTDIADIAVDGDGTLHIVMGAEDGATVRYATRNATGTWAGGDPISEDLVAQAIAIAVDSADAAHVVITGTYGPMATKPEGCDDSQFCTIVIEADDTPTPVGIIGTVFGFLDATATGDGVVDVLGSGSNGVTHVGNATASWASETVDAESSGPGSIVHGPDGLAILHSRLNDPDFRRSDWTGSEWDTTTLPNVINGGEVSGAVDANDRPHMVGFFHYNHPGDGGFVPALILVAPDDVDPAVSAPRVGIRRGETAGSTVAVTANWTGVDALSGIDTYRAGLSDDGGPWSSLTTRASAVTARLDPGGSYYQFRVRATDADGNVGSYAYSPSFRAIKTEDPSSRITYGSSRWQTSRNSKHSGGSAHYTSSDRASARVEVQALSFAWIGTYGPTRGSVDVYVDGVFVERVKTRKAATSYKVVIWSMKWSNASETHTIRLEPVGNGRVDVDGFLVLR